MILTLLVFYVAVGVVLAVAGYAQHAEEIRARHLMLARLRGRGYAVAVMAGGAAVAVVTWPVAAGRALARRGQFGPCCCWCGIRLAGIRRWWASGCRDCSPRLCGSSGIYLHGGSPPHLHGSRAGEVEQPRRRQRAA